MKRYQRMTQQSHFTYKYVPLIFFLVCQLAIVYLIWFYRMEFLTSPIKDIQSYEIPEQEKPHLVIGILSSSGHFDHRNSQRNTWISTLTNIKHQLPFRITLKFLLDRPTSESMTEDNINKDIVYLNVTHSGRAIKFGEKMHVWLKYINRNYPDVVLGGKMDDDAFLCIPQIINRLFELKSPTLYYGWTSNDHWAKRTSIDKRMDEMFVVLGRDLIQRIAARTYCGKMKCDIANQLVDTNYGGTSLGVWLSVYDDVHFHADNNIILHAKEITKHYIRTDACSNHLIFHKSSFNLMTLLHQDSVLKNENVSSLLKPLSISGFSAAEASSGSIFSGSVVRLYPPMDVPQISPKIANYDKERNCDNWAVVTTIFPPSIAINNIAKLSNWCLVIVADIKTPSKEKYLDNVKENNGGRIKYLSVEEQSYLYPLLSESLSLNSFGRKNIGYMYAIHHKAKLIWDFDDDNDGIIDVNKLGLKNRHNSVEICKQSKQIFLNPYPYFGVNETRVWPRGFPLQFVKDSTTIPRTCNMTHSFEVGIIQSLANEQPDVDAIYRLTREVPFNFKHTPDSRCALVVPENMYSPFNAQATLWLPSAFEFLALPVSVNGRVSDIWRSYITQYFIHKKHVKLVFTPPYVNQQRNPHTIIKDLHAEQDLYLKSRQLVDFLRSGKAREYSSITEMYENLYVRKYIELSDINFIRAWQATLSYIKSD